MTGPETSPIRVAAPSPAPRSVDLTGAVLRDKARIFFGLHAAAARARAGGPGGELERLRAAIEVARWELAATAAACGRHPAASLALDLARLHDLWAHAPAGSAWEAALEHRLRRAYEALARDVRDHTS